MNPTYTLRQHDQAGRDCNEVYELAENKVRAGCLPVSREALANAFQVFRYAFQEWAGTKEVGVVMRALMYRELRRGVIPIYTKSEIDEMEIYCEDQESAEAIERILKKDGYVDGCKETNK